MTVSNIFAPGPKVVSRRGCFWDSKPTFGNQVSGGVSHDFSRISERSISGFDKFFEILAGGCVSLMTVGNIFALGTEM